MSHLILSDLHLTDNPLDLYRWDIFTELKNIIHNKNVKQLSILGDLTEAKDKHSSTLINTFIKNIENLVLQNTKLEKIIILSGNHDCVDIKNPYFKFIDKLNLKCDIKFINVPTKVEEDLYIPFCYDNFTEIAKQYSFCNNLFLHHSFIGSKRDNGTIEDKGNILNDVSCIKFNKCYSGHIHLAQKYGNIEYIGSPYPIDFGDNNEGRALLITNNEHVFIKLPMFIQKHNIILSHIDEVKQYNIQKNDQVKIKIKLTMENSYEYEEMSKYLKNYVKEKEAFLLSIKGILEKIIKNSDIIDIPLTRKRDNIDIIKEFCKKKQLSNNYVFSAYNAINNFKELPCEN